MKGMRIALGLLTVVVLAGAVAGQDVFKVEPGYTSLFNGKDLTGWRYQRSKDGLAGKTASPDKRVQVTSGLIVMEEKDAGGKGGIRNLYTVKEFDKDFNLKLQFRAALKADSGVYIRGPQLQVRDYIRRGERKNLKKFKNDDWNELDITVKGTTAICLINGEMLQKMKVPAKGPIGLQAERGKFEFRRIRIKELP